MKMVLIAHVSFWKKVTNPIAALFTQHPLNWLIKHKFGSGHCLGVFDSKKILNQLRFYTAVSCISSAMRCMNS